MGCPDNLARVTALQRKQPKLPSLDLRKREGGFDPWFRVAYSYRLCPRKEDRNCAFSPSLLSSV